MASKNYSPSSAKILSLFAFNIRMLLVVSTLTGMFLIVTGPAIATPEIGKKSPEFSATDSFGKQIRLSQFLGKIVILEWTNHDCPYVGKHYGTGNMQSLQKEATEQGVIWLSVISSAPGRQGYVSGKQANELSVSRKAFPTAVLLDPEGKIGRAYDATATPNMFVIDKQGKLVYKGAIDNIPSASSDDVKSAKNYVRQALESLAAGKSVEKAVSRPYGCSIKYGS